MNMEATRTGSFCWADMGTSDQAGARTFYESTFGWRSREIPLEAGETYTVLEADGGSVAALYQMAAEQRRQGVPPYWLPYVAVDDAEATVTKARALGAKVVVDAFSMLDAGRMALLLDPGGAMFAVWQAVAEDAQDTAGAPRLGQSRPGALAWVELMSKDVEKAAVFYAGLFDWKPHHEGFAEGHSYTTFYNGQTAVAGMLPISAHHRGVPSHWLTYFAAADCDQAVAAAQEAGAKVFTPPTAMRDKARFAILQDPQGAVFGVSDSGQG